MSRRLFYSLFILMNVILIFTKIYQHNAFIKTSFNQQKNLYHKKKLLLKKDKLLMELLKLKSPSLISAYAQEELGLQKLKITQIKNLNTTV